MRSALHLYELFSWLRKWSWFMLFDFVWVFFGGESCLPFFKKSRENMPEYALQRE